MTIGKQIKSLRIAKNMSQPELSDLAGIEQSYLSKLENDKSVPSNDTFRTLLGAFEINLDTFMAGVDVQTDQPRLIQIPDIEQWLSHRQLRSQQQQRNMLYACCFAIVIGVTLFYVGFSKTLFSEIHYVYESRGVVLDGEPDDVFISWRSLLPRNAGELIQQKELEMNRRTDRESQLHLGFRGPYYVVDVEGGRRLFRLDTELEQPRRINGLFEVFGVMLFVTGVIGFVAERRIYASQ